ncbi:ThuA domain-containing protein [Alkalibacterium sp. s-m-22]
MKEGLTQVLDKLGDVTILYADRKELTEHLKDRPDLVILASENRLDPESYNPEEWMTEFEEDKIVDYVKKGGSWLVWHSGLVSYQKLTTYIDMVGGSFDYHPEKPVSVNYKYIEESSLTDRKEEFSITDEHCFINYGRDVTVTMTSSSEYEESVAGWTVKYGEVCVYIPAHNKEGLMSRPVKTDLEAITKKMIQ